MSNGLFWSHWAFEMRRKGLELGKGFAQALELLRSSCEYILAERSGGVVIGQEVIHTIRIVTHFHHPRTDTQEEHAIFLVLHVELGHDDVQGRLGGSIQATEIHFGIVGHVEVSRTAGNGNDLLGLALQDKRKEEVEKVDVADDIGLPQLP